MKKKRKREWWEPSEQFYKAFTCAFLHGGPLPDVRDDLHERAPEVWRKQWEADGWKEPKK